MTLEGEPGHLVITQVHHRTEGWQAVRLAIVYGEKELGAIYLTPEVARFTARRLRELAAQIDASEDEGGA